MSQTLSLKTCRSPIPNQLSLTTRTLEAYPCPPQPSAGQAEQPSHARAWYPHQTAAAFHSLQGKEVRECQRKKGVQMLQEVDPYSCVGEIVLIC